MVMIVGTSLKISGATKINLNEDSNAANNGQLISIWAIVSPALRCRFSVLRAPTF
jgi:hypothetical protein